MGLGYERVNPSDRHSGDVRLPSDSSSRTGRLLDELRRRESYGERQIGIGTIGCSARTPGERSHLGLR
jgi:hypothetical protein